LQSHSMWLIADWNCPRMPESSKRQNRLPFFCSMQASLPKRQILERAKARVVVVGSRQGKLNLSEIVHQIGRDGMHTLWVEAGGRLVSSFLKEKLLNQAYFYVSPTLLGQEAVPAFTEPVLQGAKTYRWKGFGKDALCEVSW